MDKQILDELKTKVRLIVSDMDGTLLNSKKQVSEETLRVLKLLKNTDVDFTICTGRIATMVQYYTKILEIDRPIITSNGAAVYDPIKKEVLYENPVPQEVALDIIRFCKMKQLDCCTLTLENCYFTQDSKRIARFEEYNAIAYSKGYEIIRLDRYDSDLACIREKRIHKILVYAWNDIQFREAKAFLDSLREVEVTNSDHNLLDIMTKGVNKGTGMMKLMKHLGYTKEETCVFGDYYNDIPMVKAAGISFAMKNGCDEIKKEATVIADTNDDDGVAQAIMNNFITI